MNSRQNAKLPISYKKNKLYFAPIGGCGQFGMNTTFYIHNKSLLVVDCGIMFPDPQKLGIDAQYPDLRPWFAEICPPTAYLITHGHEDHVGAVVYHYRHNPAPIYCTAWTAELIKGKFEYARMTVPPLTIVQDGDLVHAGDFKISWHQFSHSIPMACGLYIQSPLGKIFHTGDFKLVHSKELEKPVNTQALKDLGEAGVDLLISDSTNSHLPGLCPDEDSIFEPLKKQVEAATGRVVVATFSSNLWRLLTLIRLAKATDRKIFFDGAGIKRTLEVARTLKMLPELDGIAVVEGGLKNVPKNKLMIVCTGCQGEYYSSLARICREEHRYMKLASGDSIIFSSRIIPGSEKAVYNLISLCSLKQINVITTKDDPNIHVSGHAHAGDIENLIGYLKPKNHIPVHGTYTHQRANMSIANDKTQVDQLALNGQLFQVNGPEVEMISEHDVEWLYIDASSRLPLGRSTIKDRHRIGELGCVYVSGVLSGPKKKLIGNFHLDFRGLSEPADFDSMDKWESRCQKALQKICHAMIGSKTVKAQLNESIRIEFRRFLEQHFRKKVVVIVNTHII